MSVKLCIVKTPGGSYAATVQRVSDGLYWVPGAQTWSASPTFASKSVSFTEGTNENLGSYTAQIDSLSVLGDPGKVRIRVHDLNLANRSIGLFEGFIVDNEMAGVDVFPSTRATPSDVTAQVNDFLGSDPLPELSAAPPATPTIKQLLMLLYMVQRNKSTSTQDRLRIHNNAGEVVVEHELRTSENEFTREKARSAL